MDEKRGQFGVHYVFFECVFMDFAKKGKKKKRKKL